ncbi:hypothetical protein M2323_000346 [Rhodoblastus acidophilus]|uniref:hypothetical protein n=1 Tax=Rhodoblastus acidophilus TaxID=1074 RepID=UPI0022242CBD|nr:hypothetical protein [Rhodoblastus acidophilus]MCW2282585.1 hypothetical protein [Rhodoblastus acidophilus]MCW2331446.1 hypothetical protein [Rhodoblastus acidophilus]
MAETEGGANCTPMPLWRGVDIENERRFALDKRVFNTAATIVVAENGGPLRTIVTGGKIHYTGDFQSRKNGRTCSWESEQVELPGMMEAEVLTTVKWWLAQPFRCEIQDGPKKLVYTPDQVRRVLEGDTWRVLVIEYKRDLSEAERDEDYARKLDAFRQLCRGVGWRFEIRDKKSLGTPTYRRNVEMIALDRRTHVALRDLDAIRALAEDGAFAYGAGCERLGGYVAGKKKLHAMMVRRLVSIPLTRTILRDTPVALVDRSREPIGGSGLFD